MGRILTPPEKGNKCIEGPEMLLTMPSRYYGRS